MRRQASNTCYLARRTIICTLTGDQLWEAVVEELWRHRASFRIYIVVGYGFVRLGIGTNRDAISYPCLELKENNTQREKTREGDRQIDRLWTKR